MKTATVWLNKAQVRRVKNIHNWKDEEVYQAHTQESAGFIPYVSKSKYDNLMRMLGPIYELASQGVKLDVDSDLGKDVKYAIDEWAKSDD